MTDADEVVALARAVQPLLMGKPAEIQGAALANLMAIWLAKHGMRGDAKAIKHWRDKVLKVHLETVRKLALIHQRALVEPQPRPDP